MNRIATSTRRTLTWPILGVLLCTLHLSAHADPDAVGCKDAFLSRMAGFHIGSCDDKDFDEAVFVGGTAQETRVEGRVLHTVYVIDEGKKVPSQLAVKRNYEDAMRQGGWTIVNPGGSTTEVTAKRLIDSRETWAELQYNDGNQYILLVVQKADLAKSVTTADAMQSALEAQGHVALDVHFDTGRATLRPDAMPLLGEMVRLLSVRPSLRLTIEGHTDNVGNAASNKSLSQARAKAVMAHLVAHGIAASRLTAVGYGQERPIADNATEAGRGSNRRVELVKQ